MISYSMITEMGNRDTNEDAVRISENNGDMCFIVCDGLGGHGMGYIASAIASQSIADDFSSFGALKDFSARALETAQEKVMYEQAIRKVPQKMKTTAVVLITTKKKAYIAHCGDSRCYIFANNTVKRRTIDHSVPQMLALTGEITESEIRNHPDRSILLNVIGTPWSEPMYELMKPMPIRKAQAFLLCSDGFWELIDESAMCRTLSESGSVKEWLERMANVVRINGSGKDMDNYSAIAVFTN